MSAPLRWGVFRRSTVRLQCYSARDRTIYPPLLIPVINTSDTVGARVAVGRCPGGGGGSVSAAGQDTVGARVAVGRCPGGGPSGAGAARCPRLGRTLLARVWQSGGAQRRRPVGGGGGAVSAAQRQGPPDSDYSTVVPVSRGSDRRPRNTAAEFRVRANSRWLFGLAYLTLFLSVFLMLILSGGPIRPPSDIKNYATYRHVVSGIR